jgi:hypothetical protein
MMDHLIRDLQILRKADFLIAKIWLNFVLRRFGLFAFAALIALFGLGMANVACFYALQAPVGAMWAAGIVAAADLVFAAIVLLIASRSNPGPELDLALEVHSMAAESIQVDARDVKLMFDSWGREVREAKMTIAQFVHNPLNLAAQKVLVPAALSIVRGLRSKKERT